MLTSTTIHPNGLQRLEFLLPIFSRIDDNMQRRLVTVSRIRFSFGKFSGSQDGDYKHYSGL
jgi:hypothetical protein